jgi:ATP-dependent RNA helicase RhlE
LAALLKTTEIKSALIFTRTKHGADKLAKRLVAEGHSVGVLHGNRSQHQRTTAMEGFRQGKLKLLVATDIAARGIDVKGISHVINFDVPRAPEDYVHRVGRTARAYGAGDAVTFMDPSLESGAVRDIEKFTGLVFPRAVLPTFTYDAPSPRPSDSSSRPAQRNDSRRRHGPPDHRRNEPRRHSREERRRDDRPGNSGRNNPPQHRGNPPPSRREDPPRKEHRPASPGSYRGKYDPIGHPTRPRGYF